MHTWLGWSSRDSVESPLHSPKDSVESLPHAPRGSVESLPHTSRVPHTYCISTDWRVNCDSHPRICVVSETNRELRVAAGADLLATIDLLSAAAEDKSLSPWWRVAPDDHLLDEFSETTPIDAAVAQTKQDIVFELKRLSMCAPHKQQSKK